MEMVSQLHGEIQRAVTDPTSRCLVIEGEGEHFCAGRDLQSFGGALPYAELVAADGEWANIFRMLDQADLPSVAIVRGCAFMTDSPSAMGCDFVLADLTAQFQVSEMRQANFLMGDYYAGADCWGCVGFEPGYFGRDDFSAAPLRHGTN